MSEPRTIDAGADVLARKAALTDAAARLETLGAGIRKLRLVEWPSALAGTVAADARTLADLLASLVAPVAMVPDTDFEILGASASRSPPPPEPSRPSKSRK